MRMFLLVVIGLVVMLSGGLSWADTGVAVESKTVAPGDTNVTIGIYVENDLPVVGIVIPLEIRSLDRGAFIADQLALTVHNRLLPWENGSCFKVIRYLGTLAREGAGLRCYTVASADSDMSADSAADFVSPDAVMYTCVGVEPQHIAPGADGAPGNGEPSLVLTFNVTQHPGRFEIDTTCVPPANHIMFVSDRKPFEQSAVSPSYFNKGIISISKR